MTRRLLVVLLALVALALPAPGWAQYFGQNKVQYERFDFQVMRTPHFDIYYYPEERAAVEQAARMAEEWRTRLSATLRAELRGRQPLVLYAAQPHFAQTQTIEGLIGEGTGGVTEFLKRRMVLPFASTLGETSHVLGHELVHAFQYDIGGERALVLPLWFVEGMAEYLTLGADDPHTAMWLRDIAREEKLPRFTDLDNPRYFPYRFGHAAWAYLASRFGDRVVADAFAAGARAGDAITGIEEATGVDIDELSEGWIAAIRQRHGSERTETARAGQVLLAASDRNGGLNVSPALSPDGRWLTFLSNRGLFSNDLYLADASTGRVVRRITKTATDPHFESLQFVGSAGAWDAASRRFAFTAVSKGRPTLTVIDIDREEPDREWTIDAADEAWHPTWSPDGRRVAFSGLIGGVSDLFVLELETGAVRRLTNDAFADLQPAWSPAGQHIAFVTDRFTTRLTNLEFGDLRLARVTVDTGAIEELPSLGQGKHINPQWDGTGNALFLVANPDGVSNVYRLDLGTRRFSRVTAEETGVSGITSLSPAVSYAPGANRLAFSAYHDGGYDVRILDAPGSTAGAAPASTDASARRTSRLFGDGAAQAPFESRTTARAASDYAIEPYQPKLTLDYAGVSTAVGAISGYGAVAAGGIGLQFSDMLGRHTLSTVMQANGGVRDLGGQVTYLNRESRWNWGGGMMLMPYVTGSLRQSVGVLDGLPVIVNEETLFRQTDLQARGIAMYPISRALRFEVQAGARRLWFSRERTTALFLADTGQFIGQEREDLDAPSALNLTEAAAALVYDQSIFGPTSPIAGQRYRFEVTPTFGGLRFTGLLLDYRRYLPVGRPFTFAVRGLHVGRYGADSEDVRLSTLFVGYPSLVRGYDVGSFEARDCGVTSDGSCPAFDNLLGSRLLVGNAELRFPLFGVFTGQYRYGPIPVEGFLFADSGMAWTSSSTPEFAGGDRRFVSSLGAGLRVNALGYLILELAAARPLDRPGRGWLFGINMTPGF